ncbi:MAG: sulfatase-like hydrolase/transferase [SAR324 cluster bacterium]|nr:sulfatase-like hydrolase/transferase [SAR324 cluster bacterium]
MKLFIKWILFLLLPFLGGRLGLIFLYPKDFTNLSFSQKASTFTSGLSFDLSSIAVFTLIPFLLLFLPLLNHNQTWKRIWLGFLLFISLVFVGAPVGDLAYYPFVHRHLTYELNLLGLGDISGIFKMIGQGFLLELTLFLALGWGWVYLGYRLFFHKDYIVTWKGWGLLFLILAIIGRGGFTAKPISTIDAFASGSASAGQLTLNAIFSMSHAMLFKSNYTHEYFSPEEALSRVLPKEKQGLNYPFLQEFKKKQPESTPKNLVFILVESLSSKYLGHYKQYSPSLTPHLDKIVAGSWFLSNHYATGQRSLEGIQAVLTGLPPLIGLPTIGVGVPANSPKMGEMFGKNGYDSLYVQAMERGSFRGETVAGFAGFKHFYGKEDIPLIIKYPNPDGAVFGWDHETLQFALKETAKLKPPFINFIVTSTTHTPYPLLPKGMARFPHSIDGENGFKNSLIYTDWALGQYFKEAKKQAWFEDTIFVITADHALPHYGDEEDSLLSFFNIPLIIYQPSEIKPKLDTQVASQLDILPTLADLMGLEGKWSFLGSSLAQKREHPFAMMRNGVLMLLVTNEGWLRHTLKKTIDSGEFKTKSLRNEAAQKLLAINQVTYKLISKNKWQPLSVE